MRDERFPPEACDANRSGAQREPAEEGASEPKQRGATTAVTTPDWQTEAQAEKPPQATGAASKPERARNSPQKATHEELMEAVVSPKNATAAWKAVVRNGGAPGIDGMTTEKLGDHVRKHWETIRSKLLAGTYVPSPVRRVEIPKPNFFDRVNHDILMTRIGRWIRDKAVLRLIGRYLRAGVMVEGLVQVSEEGTPHGGPLSPLLANIYLARWTRNWTGAAWRSADTPTTATDP